MDKLSTLLSRNAHVSNSEFEEQNYIKIGIRLGSD